MKIPDRIPKTYTPPKTTTTKQKAILLIEEELRQKVKDISKEFGMNQNVIVEFVPFESDIVQKNTLARAFSTDNKIQFNLTNISNPYFMHFGSWNSIIAHELWHLKLKSPSYSIEIPDIETPASRSLQNFVLLFVNIATDFTIYYEIPKKYTQFNFSDIQPKLKYEMIKTTIGVTAIRHGVLLETVKGIITTYGLAYYAIGTEHYRILSELEEIVSDFPELTKIQDFLMKKLVPFAKGQIKISEVNRQDLADEAATFYKKWLKSIGMQI